jgi:hypothetical protein
LAQLGQVEQAVAVLEQAEQFVLYGRDKHDNSQVHKYAQV